MDGEIPREISTEEMSPHTQRVRWEEGREIFRDLERERERETERER